MNSLQITPPQYLLLILYFSQCNGFDLFQKIVRFVMAPRPAGLAESFQIKRFGFVLTLRSDDLRVLSNQEI